MKRKLTREEFVEKARQDIAQARKRKEDVLKGYLSECRTQYLHKRKVKDRHD